MSIHIAQPDRGVEEVEVGRRLPEELQIAVANIEDPAELAHMIAGALRITTQEKQALLEERNLAKRLRKLSELLARELDLVSLGTRIQSQVQSEMDKAQREYFLRQQLHAIQEELGADVAAGEASASYEDGVLRVEVPLVDADEQVRQIRIQSAGDEP